MSAPRRLRVLVVDDSAVQRQLLARLLTQDDSIELAGSASNGAEAVRAVARLKPDVVTLDDRMPVMSGLDAARQIMRETPTPIVMISAATGDDARQLADTALAAGVLAVQGKRALSSAEPGAVQELVRLIKGMAEVRVVRRRREPVVQADTPSAGSPPSARTAPEIVAIGASTGGPQALREILSQLPDSFGLPIVVVQHTTVGYSNTLVDWLTGATSLPVHVAADGQALDRGAVYVAPTGLHLVVLGRRLALLNTPAVSMHCPSATMLFTSVAQTYGARGIGVLLTGMGDDGAAGLLEMRQAGALTIAQDEASSVVFGMPAEAIRTGAAHYVLPPRRIASLLIEQAAAKRGDDTAWI
jgi:two-component system, chemotaxis family, protein-glutamate methylesterase/glutaminase